MRSVQLKRAKAKLSQMLGVDPHMPMAEMIDLVESRCKVAIDRKPVDKRGMALLLISMGNAHIQMKPTRDDSMMNFPAPEEARSYKEYVELFRATNPRADFKEACAHWLRALPSSFASHKQYYDWCWQQPEAEAIHEAFK